MDILSPYFYFSPLPGRKKGITGTTVTGYNIGIDNSISNSKKNDAITVLKFITSKDLQKKLVINNLAISGISSIYNEAEVCEIVDCALYKNSQFVAKPVEAADNFDEYDEKYRSYIRQFLFGDKEAKDVLKSIINLTKLYYFSLSTDDSYVGLINFILITVCEIIMFLSLIFVLLESYSVYFRFFSTIHWIILILGIELFISVGYTKFGELTATKCFLKIFLLSIGSTLVLYPILYRLIKGLPEDNIITDWIDDHKYIFFVIFISIDLLLNLQIYLVSFETEIVKIPNGQNFQ
eukprot:jgi/Orpsp1_1/1191579/evm.model.d7180000087128.1